jgi:hypothetical protein
MQISTLKLGLVSACLALAFCPFMVSVPPNELLKKMYENQSDTVETSSDGINWKESLAQLKGKEGENVVSLGNVKTKFIRLQLNEDLAKDSDEVPWSMRKLKVFGQN